MNEHLLQYIWKYRLYNSINLYTTCSKKINTIYQGFHNSNQGPDFLNARIKIGDSMWAGHVEIHVKSSDWELHNHSEDEQYSNVILHVVWCNDRELNLPFPTLEIQSHVPKVLLDRYSNFMKESSFIACEKNIHRVDNLIVSKCKERMLIERLQLKSTYIAELIMESKGDWEEVSWWILAKSFGGKINGDDFEKIARSIPLKILYSNKHSLLAIEAIIFGQSGLLSKNWSGAYPNQLKREYLFFKRKYKLKMPRVSLKFLRMRPSNFPSIKLAQLSSFIFQTDRLFTFIKKVSDEELCKMTFSFSASEYWDYHYCFDDDSIFKNKLAGKTTQQHILINCFIFILYAFGYYYDEKQKMNQAVKLLSEMNAEKNIIINKFRKMKVTVENAFDSQSILHLYNNYCQHKKCLNCMIGYAVFNK